MSYHQTLVVGNLGRDPELQYHPQTGQAWCRFSIAVTERWTDRNTQEKKEKTTWYNVSIWGPQAENVNAYLKKGSQALVIGTVEARLYTNNAGQPAVSLDLRARDVRFLGGRGDREGVEGVQYDDSAPQENVSDIPF
jgi:single-strand DNA-binding protein